VSSLVLGAFVLRLVLRLARGEADFLHNGYRFYLAIATHFLHGDGLCLASGTACAVRMPVYPVVISAFVAAGSVYPGLVIAQAACAAGLVWIAWKIGLTLFDRPTARLAACMTAASPYAVVHDTALQETAFANVLVALAVLLLLQARRLGSWSASLGAGVALALATLTTARVALVVPGALGWCALAGGSTWQARWRTAVLVALPVLLGVGGWTLRNWQRVGAPVLTTEAGESLWIGNNDQTFSYFPLRSIDLSAQEAFDRLGPAERSALDGLEGRDVERDRLLAGWGRQYMAAHPFETVRNGWRKLWVATSGQLSPARGLVTDVGYALVYAPVHLLAAVGLWRSRRGWHTHSLLYLVFLAFAITTTVFWAHTSQKSYLDVFLFVYAASILARHSGAADGSVRYP
jgi:4-amino-4-deoxy-L-arabinose transferase-like glycosyltransferase